MSTKVLTVEDIDILQCDNCSHQFADIAETKEHITSVYGDDYFFDGGAGYDNYVRDSILFEQHGERYAKMVSRFLSPGTMIEIGAAAGFGLITLACATPATFGVYLSKSLSEITNRSWLCLDRISINSKSFAEIDSSLSIQPE